MDISMAVSPGLTDSLARQEKARRQLAAIASVLGRANRIVTGEPVSLVVSDHGPAGMPGTPGWTDGETIWLNGPDITKRLTTRGTNSELILALKGVNYHELAHVLYSPRKRQEVSRQVWMENQRSQHPTWWSFIILEDMRAELLFITDYQTAMLYFTRTVAEWIQENPANKLDDLWPLMAGRMYLPPELRKAARDAFANKYGDAVADEVRDIARSYLRIVYPAMTNKGLVLIKRYAEIIYNLQVNQGLNKVDPVSGTYHDPSHATDGRSMGGFQGQENNWRQKDAANDRDDILDYFEDEDERFEAEQSDTDSKKFQGDVGNDGEDWDGMDEDELEAFERRGVTEGGDDDSDDTGNGNADGKAQQSNGNNTEAQDGQGEDGEGQGDTHGGNAAGISDPNSDLLKQADVREKLIDLAEDISRSVTEMADIREDVNTTLEAVRREIDSQIDVVEGYEGKFHDRDVSAPERLGVRNIVNQLNDLRVDLEPLWIQDQPSGALNVKRAMLAQAGDLDIFDLWDDGSEEEASTEVVILLDQSSSMNHIMAEASVAMWMLKRAFDESDIRTTVLGYNDDWHVLYQPSDHALSGKVRMFPCAGGTYPDRALRQAGRIFRGSRATNTILISITDGDWVHSNDAMDAITSMRRDGVNTLMVNIGGYPYHTPTISKRGGVTTMPSNDSRLCYHEKGYYLGKIIDIVPIVESLVTDIMVGVRRGGAAY